MTVMLLGGLWHGAGWTFVIWGGLHGVYLVINHAWCNVFGKNRMPAILGRAMTFLAVLVAWVMFRSADLPSAVRFWSSMLGLSPSTNQSIGASMAIDGMNIHGWAASILLLAVAWLAPNTQQIMARYHPGLDTEDVAPARWTWEPNLASVLAVGAILAPALYFILFTDRMSDFLYFQF
jgi:hypothetical protein